MRLAQLARKIAVKPADVVEFLTTQSIQVENSSNAKVEDSHVELVLRHFAPELLQTVHHPVEESPLEIEQEPEQAPPPIAENSLEEEAEEKEVIREEEPPVEVIKPPKVELPGLKVVGKIDLPEPRKKDEAGDEEKADEEVTPRESPAKPRIQTKRNQSKRDQDRRPRKNPIALQREREEREQLRRRQEEKKKEKELRTRRYLNKVSKQGPAFKPLKRKKHEEEYEVLTEEKAQPKSFFGKLLNWFVSE